MQWFCSKFNCGFKADDGNEALIAITSVLLTSFNSFKSVIALRQPEEIKARSLSANIGALCRAAIMRSISTLRAGIWLKLAFGKSEYENCLRETAGFSWRKRNGKADIKAWPSG